MIPKDSTVGADAERTLHRLEAFSDIVIGFCIAEMGINLLIPGRATDTRTILTAVGGFAFSFVLISIVWWVHQRIFRTYFILTPLTLILNFTLLGGLVLMVYLQQVAVHFFAPGGSQAGNLVRLWTASYCLVYGLLAAMLWIGLRERWSTVSEADLRWGMHRASILSIGAAMFLLYAAGLAGVRGGAIFVVGPVAVLLVRWLIPNFVDRIVAARA